jgi:hypothetical protein
MLKAFLVVGIFFAGMALVGAGGALAITGIYPVISVLACGIGAGIAVFGAFKMFDY